MKRRIVCLAACTLLWMNRMSVQADVIWEPMHDPFYSEYADECVYENSTYIANGPEGKVIVYESPEASEEVTVWENGKSAYISFVYEDDNGVLWGIHDNGDVTQSGWIRIDQMAKKYDSNAFVEEFAEQIVEEEVTLNEEAKGAYFWRYPGSKEGHYVELGENTLSFHRIFTDEEGRKWGYIGYFMGMKNYWICVEVPEASFEELYPNGAPQRGCVLEGTDEIVVAGQETMESIKSQEVSERGGQVESVIAEENQPVVEDVATEKQVPIVIACITAVVGVTGGLLVLLKRSFRAKK